MDVGLQLRRFKIMKLIIEIETKLSRQEIMKELNNNFAVWKKFNAIEDFKIKEV